MAESIVEIEAAMIILMLLACLAAMALRRSRFPVSVALVLTGIVLALAAPYLEVLDPLETFVLSQEMILYVLLPPLIMVAAVKMDLRAMTREAAPVLLLSTVGVLISALIVAWALSALIGMPLGTALLFGALISATDPLAVIATIDRLGAPKRLSTIIDGESLLNDATSIVIFSLALLSVTSSTQMGIDDGLAMFIVSFVGGVGFGVLVGLVLGWALEFAKGLTMVQATLTFIAAYASYIISEDVFGVSGVVSVLLCGLMASMYVRNHVPPGDREMVTEIVEFGGFVANGLIFLLIGVSMVGLVGAADISMASIPLVIIAIAIVLVSRAMMVMTTFLPMTLITGDEEGRGFIPVIVWGGLRGAIALALALSLPEDLPWRDEILLFTISVVAFTMLVNGTTTGVLIRRLGLDREDARSVLEDDIHKVATMEGAIDHLDGLESLTGIEALRNGVERVRSGYLDDLGERRSRIRATVTSMDESGLGSTIWDLAMRMEKRSYRRLYDRGLIGERALYVLSSDVDFRSDVLRRGGKLEPRMDISGGRWERLIEDIWTIVSPERADRMRYRVRFETLSGMYLMGHLVSKGLKEMASDIPEIAGQTSIVEGHYRMVSEQAQRIMGRMTSVSPGTATSSEVVQAGRVAIQGERDAVERLLADGLIDRDTRDEMISEIDERGSRFSLL